VGAFLLPTESGDDLLDKPLGVLILNTQDFRGKDKTRLKLLKPIYTMGNKVFLSVARYSPKQNAIREITVKGYPYCNDDAINDFNNCNNNNRPVYLWFQTEHVWPIIAETTAYKQEYKKIIPD